MSPPRALLAAFTLIAVLAGASIPCPAPAAPGPDLAAHAEVAAAASTAFCSEGQGPRHALTPVCPCGCGEGPDAGLTPVASGWGLRAAEHALVPPPLAFAFQREAVVRLEPPPAAPDPVPLV